MKDVINVQIILITLERHQNGNISKIIIGMDPHLSLPKVAKSIGGVVHTEVGECLYLLMLSC